MFVYLVRKTIFELQRVTCRKSPNLNYRTRNWRLRWGDPVRISQRFSASIGKLESRWAIVWRCLREFTFRRFSETPTDRQTVTDRQTDTWRQHRLRLASI